MFRQHISRLYPQTTTADHLIFCKLVKERLNDTEKVPLNLCRKYFLRALHVSANKSVKLREDEKKGRNPPSLIVRKLLQSQQSADGKNSKYSVEDLSLKLDKISKDVQPLDSRCTETIVSPDFGMQAPNKSEKEWFSGNSNITNGDNFIEDVILKQDLQTQQKPSPLLGTEDHSVPASDIPCVGCGAPLHCQHRTVPGFIPSERYKLLSKSELKSSICQRCHYIQHCDAFVEVTSTPQDYAEIITKIRPTRSVVVMVVDVMDIQGSIVPNLTNYIGHQHPLVVVGNKVDLIAPDSTDYLLKIKESIKKSCYDASLKNIRKVMLISAKTGFGIERLINALFSFYKMKVDVFIVGTANSGKSTLFNSLLASDYCQLKARDLIQRATVSVWPGTTLNLLKFPVMRPTPRNLSLRQKRLKQEKAIKMENLKQERQKKRMKEKMEKWELKEDVRTTDIRTEDEVDIDAAGRPWGQEVFAFKGGRDGAITAASFGVKETFDESQYAHSYWVYDTPGVINPDQALNLLEPEECRGLQPLTLLIPRCLVMKPGMTIFVSGLARLDYVQGDEDMLVTVHCNLDLPIRVVAIEEADEYYQQHIGTPEFGIPVGDASRVDRIPSLVGKEIEVEGEDSTVAVADIQMSSVGWISLAPQAKCVAKLRAYTPGRRGISLRCPPLVPNFKAFKGKRIAGTPFFRTRPVGHNVKGNVLKGSEDEP